MSVESLKKQWNACLSKSGGSPGQCTKLENELSAASKAAGVDACISETVKLMRCTQSSARKGGCNTEFLMMRECNRPAGRQIVSEGSGLAMGSGVSNLFAPGAASIIMSTPPARTLEGMTDFGQSYASSLGVSAPAF
mmetsp:Transcript_121844/g.191243  ORF Transcript_121844/g.191243 Transcript_121844/m.191243 type:complete len:137 (+) Transcript_121844:97-507(+)